MGSRGSGLGPGPGRCGEKQLMKRQLACREGGGRATLTPASYARQAQPSQPQGLVGGRAGVRAGAALSRCMSLAWHQGPRGSGPALHLPPSSPGSTSCLPPGSQMSGGACWGHGLRASVPSGTSPPTGVATPAVPPRPHPGPGRAAGGDKGGAAVHLCLSDGVFTHHVLPPPCQVGLRGAAALEGGGPLREP